MVIFSKTGLTGKAALLFLLFLSLFIGCEKKEAQNKLRVGHGGGYLSATLYAVKDSQQIDIQRFQSLSDVAYALILGSLDIGFVEAEKLAALSALDGFDRLTVIGKITYPYGSTLVLRKGLNNRLQELNGLTIAASAPKCKLLEEFAKDAKRLGADISNVKYEYMVFDAMVPALEAKEVDAAIIKGAYSVVALQEGNSILYQNWDMKPGDECCPAIIDQAILVLLAHRDKVEAAKPLLDALVSAQKLSPDQLRQAVANNTVIPFNILQGQPVPEFSLANDDLVKIFAEHKDDHHDDHHDHHDDHDDHDEHHGEHEDEDSHNER